MVAHAYNPSTQETRWEDHEFSASLSYKANPLLKQLQPQNNVKNKRTLFLISQTSAQSRGTSLLDYQLKKKISVIFNSKRLYESYRRQV